MRGGAANGGWAEAGHLGRHGRPSARDAVLRQAGGAAADTGYSRLATLPGPSAQARERLGGGKSGRRGLIASTRTIG